VTAAQRAGAPEQMSRVEPTPFDYLFAEPRFTAAVATKSLNQRSRRKRLFCRTRNAT
jgi:hypothetical protein